MWLRAGYVCRGDRFSGRISGDGLGEGLVQYIRRARERILSGIVGDSRTRVYGTIVGSAGDCHRTASFRVGRAVQNYRGSRIRGSVPRYSVRRGVCRRNIVASRYSTQR